MSRPRLHRLNTTFILSAHLMAVAAVVYLAAARFSWWTVGLGLLWGALCTLSISGGYHRLFAHAAYTAAWPLRLFYLMFGAASVQNSALAWAADHRTHHADTDGERDPYSISRGFWWAHIGWVLHEKEEPDRDALVGDLQADPLVAFQDRHYVKLAILFGALAPAALGLLWGDPLGAFLVAGWLRIVVQWHVTFSVNSFAHLIGRQPYDRNGTARDSHVLALVTFGEGYHNFHHRFQADYRNGVRWFDFDPTKWLVWSASRIGLARDLRRAPRERVLEARRVARGA